VTAPRDADFLYNGARMSIRWLVTGANGMVGHEVANGLRLRGESAVALDRSELDITDPRAVDRAFREIRPSIAVNCAAYTSVDDAEANEALATAVNGSGVEHLANAATRAGALLVQLSTDFVFDGSKRTPYNVNDPTAPLSAYGRSKLIGEHEAARAARHLIIRTAWLFGARGPNFVEAIRGQIRNGSRALRVVNDQRGRPTYAPHLAAAVIRLACAASEDEGARGIVHYADSPECTWFDFAGAIVKELRARGDLPEEVTVTPVTSNQFRRPAARPAYSVLSTERYERLTGVEPQPWREGLAEYLALP
jgi:dTDP-4-dehydrorhamnose reductase